jgi:hypothetical protein
VPVLVLVMIDFLGVIRGISISGVSEVSLPGVVDTSVWVALSSLESFALCAKTASLLLSAVLPYAWGSKQIGGVPGGGVEVGHPEHFENDAVIAL